jgi:hypothetical protein
MQTKREPRWQISVRLDAIAARNLDTIEECTGEKLAQLIQRLIREEYERLATERGESQEASA